MPLLKVSGIWYLVSGIRNTKYKILNTKYCKPKGFTLIELLIVISIIGILASITLASYNNTQEKARDGIRKSDLSQMKRAMELAKTDCQGSAYYPYSYDPNGEQAKYEDIGRYLSHPNLKYISSYPNDPKYPSGKYWFSGTPDVNNVCPNRNNPGSLGQPGVVDFSFYILLERTSDADSTKSRQQCAGKPGATLWNSSGWYVVCNN